MGKRRRCTETGEAPRWQGAVVISQRLADRYWPSADPIGPRLTFDRLSRTIIGDAGDVRQSLIRFSESAQMTLYVPLAQQAAPTVVLVARGAPDAEALLPQLRQDLSSLDSRLTIGQIQTMKQLIAHFNVGLNLFNVILGGFGLLALVLAAVGTYGVQAYDVAQRSHEIGVRLAMGSPRSRLLLHAEFEWVALYASRPAMEEQSWRAPWVTLGSLWPDEPYWQTKGPSISDRCVLVEGSMSWRNCRIVAGLVLVSCMAYLRRRC